jgi:mannose-6-phosphate isomerase-like protein (cupin superfamily)
MPIIKSGTPQASTFKGEEVGATISVIVDDSGPGQGPRLHRHTYDETWVVHEGQMLFQLGDQRHHVGPGDIVVAPPGVPHKFTNEGAGRAKLVCIHASPTMVTEWLE